MQFKVNSDKQNTMFKKILVANRGEIAVRILKTLNRLNIPSVAIYSAADTYTPAVTLATEAICIGSSLVADSYLNWQRILQVAQQTGADAIHPGYGFLSENAEFAEACAKANITFIGPTATQLGQFGLKHTAREIAAANRVPLLPGTGLLDSLEQAQIEARSIGYPVMLKSIAGGGGIGLQLCYDEDRLATVFESVQRLSQNNFSQGGLYLERYVERARHIEVQIFGDGEGQIIVLGERDCSLQRRNQKVIEETPAPGIDDALRQQLYAAALRLGQGIQYRSAGTVEFIYDVDQLADCDSNREQFYFLEVNTRLQVEHGVTEAVYGVDLIEWMIRLAAGDRTFFDPPLSSAQGHSIEVRIYAEDPGKNFQPNSGILTQVSFPADVRCDTWIETGSEVTTYYDPLLAKLIVWGEDRDSVIDKMRSALAQTQIAGIETNLDYLRQVLADTSFNAGTVSTQFLSTFHYQPQTVDVLAPGAFTMIQDYPGRLGYWNVGVPPSGAMDALAFRYANRLLDNPESAAGLELTVTGATLRFNVETVICLTGAPMQATLDGVSVQFWTTVSVKAGAVLQMGAIQGNGTRSYLAVQHGLDVPDYLGSKSTFTLGKFGGHCGRTLQLGDVLKLNPGTLSNPEQQLPSELIPKYPNHWTIGVLYGPHGSPDFFTSADIEMLFATDWEVHYNSARTGVRLIGPKPEWARTDGGEAGLHPSNIHDNAYAIGTIDFTGDMPIILGPDGPSLGGFVCPATIALAELWKIGQLTPGNTVRFQRLTWAESCQREKVQQQELATLKIRPLTPCLVHLVGEPTSSSSGGTRSESPPELGDLAARAAEETSAKKRDKTGGVRVVDFTTRYDDAILHELSATPNQIAVKYRRSGDNNLLVEYGELILDLNLRFQVHALMTWLLEHPLPGIIDLTPGIRSLQIHFDRQILPLDDLLATLIAAESELPAIESMSVPTRIVHLPLSWDDDSTQLAIDKYMRSVNPTAPWCPSNIEFIRRINGLESIEKVREIVFNASYLVLGLGDVYLGAPVATPLDPRHRLVTTKYNPARTWTPENAVGIGGAYLCVYGMEGPGGYQFVGRTVQMWNTHRQTTEFQAGYPWLLRFFDQIRFYPVTPAELLQHRADFLHGKFELKIESTTFNLREYNEFLQSIQSESIEFKTNQQAAFEVERDRWATDNLQVDSIDIAIDLTAETEYILPPNSQAVLAHLPANVWQVVVEKGSTVAADERLVILESMKMEITIAAPVSGTVIEIRCASGQMVSAGQMLIVIQE
jgi:urea carboxylase